MAAGQQTKQQQEQHAQDDHRTQLATAIKEHTDQETAERAKAREQAHGQRTAWQQEQAKLVSDAGTEAGQKHDKARTDITDQKASTDRKVADRQRDDNDAIETRRRQAEKDARKERDTKKDSDSWLGKIAAAIKDAFNALVSVIKGIFDAARAFVQGVIDKFKSFVTGLIDLARTAITGLITKLADALIKIGDTLLAAFPTLRDKFRKRIEDLRDASIRTVNKIAGALKTAVTKLLDLFAKALTAVLDFYEKALMAAVDYVRDVVKGVIDFVKSAIAALAEFAAIVADVAADPVGWLKKLGAAVVDGIRNCLWGAIKSAVRQWFNEKVQAIIGLGQLIIKVLIKGCFSLAKIARMAWDALIKSLPAMLIQILIERLISLIVPAAGAIMTIVQGAIAAYQSIGKIIAAISKFVAFLKAVKSGQGARMFAEALAAGVVALIEFVANFLMSKLGNAAKGVGTRLKGIADRILKFLARGVKAVKKGVGVVVNAAKRTVKAVAGLIKKGFKGVVRAGRGGLQAVGRMAKGAVQALGRGARALGSRLAKTKVGKALISTAEKFKAMYAKAKAKIAEWREKFKKWREDRKKNKPTPEERLEAAKERIHPKLAWVLKRGIRGFLMRGLLAAMRLWYRLSGLEVFGEKEFQIQAWINPRIEVIPGVTLDVDRLLVFVRQVSAEIVRQGVRAQQAGANPQIRPSTDPSGKPMHIIPEGTPGGQIAGYFRRLRALRGGQHDIFRFERLGDDPIDVARKQMKRTSAATNPDTRNRLVLMRRLFRSKGQSREKGLNYNELRVLTTLAGPDDARSIATGAMNLLKGEAPRGPNAETSVQVATWLTFQEQHRNVGALATNAMALDLAARGEVPLPQAIAMMPMSMEGAQGAADRVHKYLIKGDPLLDPNVASMAPDERKKEREGARKAQALMDAEVNIIVLWVRSLRGLELLNEGEEEAKQQQLLDQIRERLYNIYNVPKEFRRTGVAG